MTPPANPAWALARRILCVRLASVGEVLLCTPAMRALRNAVPGRSLTLLTSPQGAATLPFVPEVDAAIVHAAPWVAGEQPATAGGVLALAAGLAQRRFDAAVVFTGFTQSALPAAMLCWMAGIPLRLAHCREDPCHLLTDWVAEPEPAALVRHEAQRQLALVRHAGAAPPNGTRQPLSFAVRATDLAAVRDRLRQVGVDADRPWLLLLPGAAPGRYPASQWASAARLLARRSGLPLVVLAGSAPEAGAVAQIRAGCRAAHVLAGSSNLGELGAALQLAAVALTDRGGPAQVAAAVGTPVVALYALTHPQATPWHVRSRVLFQDVPCRFCYSRACPAGHFACLAGIAPERVADAVLALLAPPLTSTATALEGG